MKAIIVISSLFLGVLSKAFGSISEVCQRINPKTFQLFGNVGTSEFNLLEAFEQGKFVGKGSFGEVRKAQFGLNNEPFAAVKIVKNEYQVLKELEGLVEFHALGVGPKFFGCQYNATNILIAQELLYSDLANLSTLYLYKTGTHSFFLKRLREVIAELKVMWDNGWVHNDIKENNIMTNQGRDRLYLIDFGMAQSKNDRLKSQGSPLYFSPNKWKTSRGLPTPADDLYSIGIMVALLQASKGEVEMLSYYHPAGVQELPESCFNKYLTSDCQYTLEINARRILQKANFGNYHRSLPLRQKDTVNFTTLISMMIRYIDFTFTYDDVLSILDRLIREFEEIETKGTSVPQKTKNWMYTDSTDEPDVFEFGRKYPMVIPRELKYIESLEELHLRLQKKQDEAEALWQAQVAKRQLEKEAAQKKIAEENARKAREVEAATAQAKIKAEEDKRRAEMARLEREAAMAKAKKEEEERRIAEAQWKAEQAAKEVKRKEMEFQQKVELERARLAEEKRREDERKAREEAFKEHMRKIEEQNRQYQEAAAKAKADLEKQKREQEEAARKEAEKRQKEIDEIVARVNQRNAEIAKLAKKVKESATFPAPAQNPLRQSQFAQKNPELFKTQKVSDNKSGVKKTVVTPVPDTHVSTVNQMLNQQHVNIQLKPVQPVKPDVSPIDDLHRTAFKFIPMQNNFGIQLHAINAPHGGIQLQNLKPLNALNNEFLTRKPFKPVAALGDDMSGQTMKPRKPAVQEPVAKISLYKYANQQDYAIQRLNELGEWMDTGERRAGNQPINVFI